MSTPSKNREPDDMPSMATQSPLENVQLKPILQIAVRAAGDAVIWLGKMVLFFATIGVISTAVALFATTLLGAGALMVTALLYLRYVPIRLSPILYHQ